MRVAIPEHQGRVAPVFDCCRRMLIVVLSRDGDERAADEDWSSLPREARPARLMELSAELLICGGISCWMEERIRRAGIGLVPWIAGGVREVLYALRDGRISDPCFMMPGRGSCMRRGHWRSGENNEGLAGGRSRKGT